MMRVNILFEKGENLSPSVGDRPFRKRQQFCYLV